MIVWMRGFKMDIGSLVLFIYQNYANKGEKRRGMGWKKEMLCGDLCES